MENLPDLMEYIAKLARMARRRPLLGKDLSREGIGYWPWSSETMECAPPSWPKQWIFGHPH